MYTKTRLLEPKKDIQACLFYLKSMVQHFDLQFRYIHKQVVTILILIIVNYQNGRLSKVYNTLVNLMNHTVIILILADKIRNNNQCFFF